MHSPSSHRQATQLCAPHNHGTQLCALHLNSSSLHAAARVPLGAPSVASASSSSAGSASLALRISTLGSAACSASATQPPSIASHATTAVPVTFTCISELPLVWERHGSGPGGA